MAQFIRGTRINTGFLFYFSSNVRTKEEMDQNPPILPDIVISSPHNCNLSQILRASVFGKFNAELLVNSFLSWTYFSHPFYPSGSGRLLLFFFSFCTFTFFCGRVIGSLITRMKYAPIQPRTVFLVALFCLRFPGFR